MNDPVTNLTIAVSELIAKRRKELNLTQAQLAERLGVSQPAVSGWENGKDLPRDLLAVADALCIPRERMLAAVEAAVRSNDKVEQAIREQTLLASETREALITIYRQLLTAAAREVASP